jgi:hypothetical protein
MMKLNNYVEHRWNDELRQYIKYEPTLDQIMDEWSVTSIIYTDDLDELWNDVIFKHLPDGKWVMNLNPTHKPVIIEQPVVKPSKQWSALSNPKKKESKTLKKEYPTLQTARTITKEKLHEMELQKKQRQLDEEAKRDKMCWNYRYCRKDVCDYAHDIRHLYPRKCNTHHCDYDTCLYIHKGESIEECRERIQWIIDNRKHRGNQSQRRNQRSNQSQRGEQRDNQSQRRNQRGNQSQRRNQRGNQSQRGEQRLNQSQRRNQRGNQSQRGERVNQSERRNQRVNQSERGEQRGNQSEMRNQRVNQSQRGEQRGNQSDMRNQRDNQSQRRNQRGNQSQSGERVNQSERRNQRVNQSERGEQKQVKVNLSKGSRKRSKPVEEKVEIKSNNIWDVLS